MKTPVSAKTNAASQGHISAQPRTYPQTALTHRRSTEHADRLQMSAGKEKWLIT
jgi:hypothetical protein